MNAELQMHNSESKENLEVKLDSIVETAKHRETQVVKDPSFSKAILSVVLSTVITCSLLFFGLKFYGSNLCDSNGGDFGITCGFGRLNIAVIGLILSPFPIIIISILIYKLINR